MCYKVTVGDANVRFAGWQTVNVGYRELVRRGQVNVSKPDGDG